MENGLQNKAIPEREINRLAQMFKVLSDPTRLKIVMALRTGEICVGDLSSHLGVTESAVSHQLRRMRDLELIKHRRDGQTLYYSLNDDHVSSLFNICLEHIRE